METGIQEKPGSNKKLNQLSLWLCWSILCLGLGYAWAMAVYGGQARNVQSILDGEMINQSGYPDIAIDISEVPADKQPKRGMKPKGW